MMSSHNFQQFKFRGNEVPPKQPPKKKKKHERLEEKLQCDFNRGPNESDEVFVKNLETNFFQDLKSILDRAEEFKLTSLNEKQIKWLNQQFQLKFRELNQLTGEHKTQKTIELCNFSEQQWPTLRKMLAKR